jgi:preprotein translocase subunit SecA
MRKKDGQAMALLEKWRETAYSETANKGDLQRLWNAYFEKEKNIYAQLLENPDEEVRGTVASLAEKYGVDLMTMTGFLDGINDSLKEPNPIEEMEEDTEVSLAFDKERLYKNMVAAEADWLYELEQWGAIFDEEKRKELYKEQKSSTTIRKEAKVYPNDPCPCGSGKKYKKCCGKNK